jgi:hypothetical protein
MIRRRTSPLFAGVSGLLPALPVAGFAQPPVERSAYPVCYIATVVDGLEHPDVGRDIDAPAR